MDSGRILQRCFQHDKNAPVISKETSGPIPGSFESLSHRILNPTKLTTPLLRAERSGARQSHGLKDVHLYRLRPAFLSWELLRWPSRLSSARPPKKDIAPSLRAERSGARQSHDLKDIHLYRLQPAFLSLGLLRWPSRLSSVRPPCKDSAPSLRAERSAARQSHISKLPF